MRRTLSKTGIVLCFCGMIVLPQSGRAKEFHAESPSRVNLFAAEPTIAQNPNRRAPLIAIVDLKATTDVIPTLQIEDGERRWKQTGSSEASRTHRIAVTGMHPGRHHRIRVRIESSETGTYDLSEPLVFDTPSLPGNFPPIETRVSQPERMEPGVTLFPATLWLNDKSTMSYGYLIAVDAEGEVVWYLDTGHRIADVRVLRNGHLLYLHASFKYALEVDLLGNIIRQWHSSRTAKAPNRRSVPVYIDSMHHELLELPDGNLMALATELRQFEDFPTSVTDPKAPRGEAYVVCDEVVAFRPEDGWILGRWPLADLLDRDRLGHLSLTDFWKGHYGSRVRGTSRDWSHANGLAYDHEAGAMIVSIRHLDCLIKIDRSTGDLVWMLGDPRGWGEAWQKYFLNPDGALEWPRHQHAPELTPAGTILLYDNGNFRAPAFEQATPAVENQSRVVEFGVDERNRTVAQVWEYPGTCDDAFYCPFYGEADLLPGTGNVLITDGGHIELEHGTPHDKVPGDRQWARIFEVTRTEPPKKVFEIVCDSGPESRLGWSIYRSIRIKELSDLSVETHLLSWRQPRTKLVPEPEPETDGRVAQPEQSAGELN